MKKKTLGIATAGLALGLAVIPVAGQAMAAGTDLYAPKVAGAYQDGTLSPVTGTNSIFVTKGSIVFGGTAESAPTGATVTVRTTDGAKLCVGTLFGAGSWTCTPTKALPTGTTDVEAVVSANGKTSKATAPIHVVNYGTADTVKPTDPVVDPAKPTDPVVDPAKPTDPVVDPVKPTDPSTPAAPAAPTYSVVSSNASTTLVRITGEAWAKLSLTDANGAYVPAGGFDGNGLFQVSLATPASGSTTYTARVTSNGVQSAPLTITVNAPAPIVKPVQPIVDPVKPVTPVKPVQPIIDPVKPVTPVTPVNPGTGVVGAPSVSVLEFNQPSRWASIMITGKNIAGSEYRVTANGTTQSVPVQFGASQFAFLRDLKVGANTVTVTQVVNGKASAATTLTLTVRS